MNSIETIQLKNGLTIYLYLDTRRHSTFFQFVTNFGGLSKDFILDDQEYHLHDGIAHILEHYVVECNDEGNFIKELGQRQMDTNASTHYQITSYYFDAVEEVEFGIRTMLNGIYHVSFNEEKLEKLKNPICQEIRGKSNSKFYHSGIASMKNLFPQLHFQSIGGTIEEVKNTTIEEVELCYKAFYQPANQFIVIAGNFDKEKVLQEINNFYAHHPFEKHQLTLLPIKKDLSVLKKREIIYYPTSLDYVSLSFKIDVCKYSSQGLLDLDFYLNCFYHQFFGVISPLYKQLTEEKIITSGIHCSHSMIHHYLNIHIGGYTYDADLFQKNILDVLQQRNCFSKKNFELDKKASIIRLILREENIMSMIAPFINNIVLYHYPYLDKVEDVERLTYQEYKQSIMELDFTHYTVTIIRNK